jgi:hypothetical protein
MRRALVRVLGRIFARMRNLVVSQLILTTEDTENTEK